MSPSFSELELQRCVDGELSASSRQELLGRIEQTPEGWKTLALAFLENQTFDSAMHDFCADPELTRPFVMARKPEATPRSGRLMEWTAMAACVGIAFWLGARSEQPSRTIPGAPVRDIARSDDGGRLRMPRAPQTIAPDQPGDVSLASLTNPAGQRIPAGVLKLPFPGTRPMSWRSRFMTRPCCQTKARRFLSGLRQTG